MDIGSVTSQTTVSPLKQTSRNRIRTLDGIRIIATGAYVPECVVRNEDLAKLGYDADWIVQRTGILERRHSPAEMATSDLAFEAARQCIEQVDVDPDEIDLVIVATMTPDSQMPSTACLLQDRLGLSGPAMDVNAACAGFMYAFLTGMQFINSGTSQLALIVGADTNSRIVDPQDPKTFPLFGDGAGAILIGERVGEVAKTTYTLGADGSGKELLYVPAGGSRHPLTPERIAAREHFVRMDGRSVFKWAVRTVSESIQEVAQHACLAIDDIDLFILHQANARIIDSVAESLGIPRERLIVNLDRYGNTSAASIPLGLHEATSTHRIESGQRVVLCGFGAGLTWGTALLEW